MCAQEHTCTITYGLAWIWANEVDVGDPVGCSIARNTAVVVLDEDSVCVWIELRGGRHSKVAFRIATIFRLSRTEEYNKESAKSGETS